MKPVLIIEDDADTRRAMAAVVGSAGCPVVTAENGRVALDLLRHADRLPALVLLDLMMPVMTGWEFLQEVEHDPALAEIPVVVTSAALDVPDGTAGLLRKPVNLQDLFDMLRRYC